MKKYISYFMVAGALLLGACNDEFNKEVFRHEIGLKSVLNSEGTTNVYLRYESGGEAIYSLPVIVGGSTMNPSTIDVRIETYPDSLDQMNLERYKDRTDLYYQLLTEEYYEFVSPTCHIPKGAAQGLFDIKFKFSGLDLRYKWVLPLRVAEDPSYTPNPRQNYGEAMLRVMPFNDYSGNYSATSMQVTIAGGSPTTVDSRTFSVVDENSCFFYAGIISEEYIYREQYKINVRFNEDGTLTVTPADGAEGMNLTVGDCTWTKSETQDPVEPNIVHEYTTLFMNYTYDDVTTHPGHELTYSAAGTYLMERRINTSIPDRDQAIQW